MSEGGSLRVLAERLAPRVVHGFDSFEGLPEAWAGNQMAAGTFDRGGLLPRVPDNARLHPGWFDRTLGPFLEAQSGPAAFLHLDADLYSSTHAVLRALEGRIVPGTLLLFDEYFNYPHWQHHEHRAFEELRARVDLGFTYLAYSTQQVLVRAETTVSTT